MNCTSFKETSLALLTLFLLGLTILGSAFLVTLLVSPLLLAHPTHFYGLTWHQQLREYGRIIHFLLSATPRLTFRWLPLAPAGQHHFQEVRMLVRGGLLLTVSAGVGSGWLLRRASRTYQLWRLPNLLRWLLPWLGTLAGLLILNFGTGFWRFHELIFANRDWVFTPKKEPIIRLLTSGFFWRYFVVWVMLPGLGLWASLRRLEHQLVRFLRAAQPGLDATDDRGNQGDDDDR